MFFRIVFLGCLAAFALAEEAVYTPMYAPSNSMMEATIKSILVIIALLIFVFIWHRKILPNIQENLGTKNIRIIERAYLDPTTVLYIVKIADVYQTILVSNKQTAVLGPVSKKALVIPKPGQTPTVTDQFQKILDAVMKKGMSRAKK